jgi:two-component system phosphate regulon sensor histidine kinase PhoR
MKRVGLFWRLFPSYLIIAVIALGGMYFYASYKITDFYYLRSEKNLESNALLVKHFFFENGKIKNKAEIDGICKTLYKDSGVRITIITPAGVVLGDGKSFGPSGGHQSLEWKDRLFRQAQLNA